MAEPTQYTFELSELAQLLVERQGIKEGRWLIGFQFDMVAGNIGLPGGSPKPAAVLSVARAVLSRADPKIPLSSGLVVEAGSNRLTRGGAKEPSSVAGGTKEPLSAPAAKKATSKRKA